jgi:hypothetical protein
MFIERNYTNHWMSGIDVLGEKMGGNFTRLAGFSSEGTTMRGGFCYAIVAKGMNSGSVEGNPPCTRPALTPISPLLRLASTKQGGVGERRSN